MGRHSIYKKGPMTVAERMRRYRKKLKREQREADIEAKKQAARERRRDVGNTYQDSKTAMLDRVATLEAEWQRQFEQPHLVDTPNEADELARQIDEWLRMSPGLTIDDVLAAIDRRWRRCRP